MKTKPTTKTAREAKRPYTSSKRKRANPDKPEAKTSEASATSASVPRLEPVPDIANGARPTREIFLEALRSNYPGLEPRNNFDIAMLGTTRREGTHEELYAWLDGELAAYIQSWPSYEKAMESIDRLLDTYVEPTGPKPGDKFVFVRPIPDSDYSIRLFPGSISAAEYCMDFVETATGKAVNSPFEYELWGVPNPDMAHITMTMTGKLRSIERAHGIKQEDILPGAERFVLRDGQSCLLKRPGKDPVMFTVPLRRRQQPPSTAPLHVLDFPKVLDCGSYP
ncbi:hypothetical protein C8Q77DRAFT_1163273 [Trametes polyzona]|nr:hypothetical protein C8Q77DRAFT_1163273 [Trametes polyzona]